MTVPADLTPVVIEHLRNSPAALNLTLLAGAVLSPPGDLVIVDVPREIADDVISQMQDLKVDLRGSIAIEPISVLVASSARRAEAIAPGEGSDALVWAEVEERVRGMSALSFSFVALMSIATLLGALGAIYDNAILIVGAMVVGPDYGPLAAISVGAVRRRPYLRRLGWRALIVGFGLALVSTVVLIYIFDAAHMIDASLITSPRPNTDFIWQPDRRSLVISALAGIVGMLSITSASSTALVGVVISVTTIPAAGNAAAAFVAGDFAEAEGSFYQLVVNLVGILIAGIITLAIHESAWQRYGKPRIIRMRLRHADRRDRSS